MSKTLSARWLSVFAALAFACVLLVSSSHAAPQFGANAGQVVGIEFDGRTVSNLDKSVAVLQTARLHRSSRRRQILAQRSRDESHSWHQGRRVPHGQVHHQHQYRRADAVHSLFARIPRNQAAQRDGGKNPLGARLDSYRSRCPRRRKTVVRFESGQHAVALHLGRQTDRASRPDQKHDGVHHRSRRHGRRDRRTASRRACRGRPSRAAR